MNHIEEAIIKQRFLPIIDFTSIKNPDKFFNILIKEKINVLQVNFSNNEHMKEAYKLGEWNKTYNIDIGAGFIYSTEDAREMIHHGAKFLVSSVMGLDILQVARSHEVPAIVSGLTPTEIYHAKGTGAGLVQVFPASQIPLRSILSLQEHLPSCNLMLTGGLTLYEAIEILRLGISAVGIKGSIFQKEHTENENYAAIADSVKNFCSRIRNL
ncbi:MAG: bifunctional 4-hydroxy-2-oxoglutarate aldolase/2-dehydro-3-deoxy-phosphogluconate aldolase [Brevinema sp.]